MLVAIAASSVGVFMPLSRRLGIFLMAITTASTAAAQQRAAQFDEIVTIRHHLNYLIAIPEGYDPEGERVPLLLFLHGAGERGDDLELVKVHGPPKMIEAGHKFPAIVVSPQCPEDDSWTLEVDALIGLLNQLEADYRIDPNRIYVTGLSMGGYGAWRLAGRQPERFAAIVPVCGGGERWDAARLGKAGLPIWAFHGDHDTGVPLSEALMMVDVVNSAENDTGRARLTVFPDTGHNSWEAAYDDPQLWKWLFAQRREPQTEEAAP
jgi:predicted peptidase